MCRKRKASSIASCGRISSLRTSAASCAPARPAARRERARRAPPTRTPARRPRRARARPARRPGARRAERRGAPGSSAAASPGLAAFGEHRERAARRRADCPRPISRIRARAPPRAASRRASSSISSSDSASESGSSVTSSAAPPPQAGRSSQQLRPREAEEQDRRVARPVGEVLEQVEERRLGPVDVVDDERERPLRARAARAPCAPPRRSPPARPAARRRVELVLGAGLRGRSRRAASR